MGEPASQTREPVAVRGERGAVATSHPDAARAAVEMLDLGGSAADAAVAAAAVLCVVDPRSTGIGGDAFALFWPPSEPAPTALAASGVAPKGLSVAALRDAGHTVMPTDGPWSITVPGAVAGWDALLARFGRLGLDTVLQPAIDLAERGFAVAPRIAEEWAMAADKLARDAAAAALFLPGGYRRRRASGSPTLSLAPCCARSRAAGRRRSTRATSRRASATR